MMAHLTNIHSKKDKLFKILSPYSILSLPLTKHRLIKKDKLIKILSPYSFPSLTLNQTKANISFKVIRVFQK